MAEKEDNQIKITIFGQEYSVKAPADPTYIQKIAEYVDTKMRGVQSGFSYTQAANRIAILSAMNITDELFNAKKRGDSDNNEIEEKITKKKKFSRNEESNQLKDPGQRWKWMVEPKYKQMFTEIEQKIQGAIGIGKFEWVDRRVFDQVCDRMTLLGVYKLMQAGEIGQINWPIARGKEAHVFHGLGVDGVIAVKIFHTSNAVFKNLIKYIEGDPRFV